MDQETCLATLGGGCFWCTEAVFQQVRGVTAVVSGYCGGHVVNPTYEQICTGATGHAEVVQVAFSPAQVSFEQLLEVFFQTHDPTTLNRQGADVGTQYRSVIFYHDEGQKTQATAVMQRLADAFASPIVTEVSPLATFFPAEEYHQNYFARNPQQGYCAAVVGPKVDKFRIRFSDLLR